MYALQSDATLVRLPIRVAPPTVADLIRADRRRKRVLRFVEHLGGTGVDHALRWGKRRLPYSCLSDDALEEVASDLAAEFWANRKHVRENRAVWARQAEQVSA